MKTQSKTEEILYSDKLVTITGDAITFHNYYFWGADKTVPVGDIEKIDSLEPSLLNGKYRYWGSGGFGVWMPMDWRRSSRGRIFHLHYKNKKFLIGFTAENSGLAENALKQMGLVRE